MQEAEKIPNRTTPRKRTPRHAAAGPVQTTDKEHCCGRDGQRVLTGPIPAAADVSSGPEWHKTVQVMTEMSCQLCILSTFSDGPLQERGGNKQSQREN